MDKNYQKLKIFVTVGTHTKPFDRLIKAVDDIAKKHKFEIFMQIGNSIYEPKNVKFKRFLNESEYEKNFIDSDIIISHGGEGSIIDALNHKKPLILVPRLKRFDEHTDDHQLDLAHALEKRKRALVVYNIKELEETILKINKEKIIFKSEKEGLIRKIKEYLENLNKY